MKIDRMAGADIISASAKEIGIESDVVLSECVWQIGEDFNHEYAHRLDIGTASKTVRLYFSDLELTAILVANRKNRIDERLRSAIAQLVPRLPSRTYATSV
ncbi:MAG: hypothetical protein ACXWJE_07990 [Burkholderiaceae bacterium]